MRIESEARLAKLKKVRDMPERSTAREVAWQVLLLRRIPGLRIPDEAIRRENLYEGPA